MSQPAPRRFVEVFPGLADVADDVLPEFSRSLPFHPLPFLQELLLAAERKQQNEWNRAGLTALEAVSVGLLRELQAARALFGDESSLLFDWVKLAIARFVARAAFDTGDLARTHEWLIRAVAVEEYCGDGEYTFDFSLLAGALAAPQELVGALVTDAVLDWLVTLFAHSTRSGDLLSHAREIFPVPGKMVSAGIFSRASFPGLVLDVLIQRAQWAARYQPQDAQAAAAPLLALLDAGILSEGDRAGIELFLATNTYPFAGEPQAERARRALATYFDSYSAGNRLLLRIASCWGDSARLRAIHPQLLEDLASIRTERAQQAASPTEALLRAGQSFRMLQPVLRAYAESGDAASVVEMLAAWSGDVSAQSLVQAPLLAVPSHPVGTLWVSGETVAPRDTTPKEIFGDFLAALNAFLDVTILFGDQPSLRPTQRGGMHPHPEHGRRFEAESTRLLRLDALSEFSTPLPDRLVLAPGLTVPVQPLLLRHRGHNAALSVSLREPLPARPLRHVALLGDNTMSSPFELDAVTSILERAGVAVDRISPTADAFKLAYSDTRYDALWVAAHGEYRSFQLERSALVLGEGESEELSLDDLAALPAPRGDRRLLVLNVCSGGHSATFGGPLGVGLGPVLAGQSQAVVSHLWPVGFQFAGAFGVLLADALVCLKDHLGAYGEAMRVVLAGREAMLQRLALLPNAAPVAERLHEGIDVGNIASWGAPTLLI
ncbi:CHAT domain-containing protein [Corallococcus exiguus]|uniref:CHAT domain-containing protein n=1 Tax=Corallococcus exiguus TaxID=83462 RepID=UPI001A8E247B|nr:CHAT domain-containing protein [Corallococcus exiguus]MBN8467778.1 CHAT domain-containing protein [Corallococcus exiguus]